MDMVSAQNRVRVSTKKNYKNVVGTVTTKKIENSFILYLYNYEDFNIFYTFASS